MVNLFARVRVYRIDRSLIKMDKIQTKPSESNGQFKYNCVKENTQNLRNYMASEKAIKAKYVNVGELKRYTASRFRDPLAVYRTKCEGLSKEPCVRKIHEIDTVNRLIPIDEQNEDSKENLTDLCCHGCENGCSATIPTPQQVSDEVFKENWLQKLEGIKEKEALLKSKEIALQNREKALLKKERDMKILEYLLKHKLKQLHLYLEENKHLNHLLGEYDSQDTLESANDRHSKEMYKKNSCSNGICTEKVDGADIDKLNSCAQFTLENCTDNVRIVNKDVHQEKTSSSSSSCSTTNNIHVAKKVKVKDRSSVKNSALLKSKSSHKGHNKSTKPLKVNYDDLDTTLSADVGDSSFVQTSQKFNPEAYRKPYSFVRSASERYVRSANNKSNVDLGSQNLNPNERPKTLTGIEEDKVLRRVTENIVALRDKSTKFQHYGYMDQNLDSLNKICGTENEKRYSYLNLETSNKLCLCQKFNKNSKDRPVSWNEDTNEWLQEKRKAYNTTMKKIHLENKENLECNANVEHKIEKVAKKKDIKNRILTVFR